MNLPIKRINKNAKLPIYLTEGSAAADIFACLEAPEILQRGEIKIIPTGLIFEIPVGYEVQLRARSGLSAKYGISLANGVGTIDADYRGEVGVILVNLGTEQFVVEPGMRIAQMVITSCPQVIFQETENVSETDRGDGGYGSTGH